MGLIPEDVIAQVIDRSDIVEVISSYLPLKGAGRSFKACCPFHHEKTPSFMVNPAKQIFHCFGCGAGGNVISFVMKQERMEFPEAVRFLAQKTGVEIPETQQSGPGSQLRDDIRRVNKLAAEYFHKNLLSDKSAETLNARKYLKERGVSREIVERFQLGFALESWDGLLNFLRGREVSLKVMERAGLVSAQKRGEGFYDLFRNRIVFPIHDSQGRCVAFGARTMDPENPAKYINSPETPLYTKGRHLYGFHLAKDDVGRADEVIVVEGYMDFVMPFQDGVTNIVASLGTALTVDQIRLIRRYTRNVCMLFDADQAGEAAMIRSLDLLIEEGMNVRVATLDQDDDPDSFIRKYGAQKFRERIAEARSFFDFKLKFYLERYGKDSAQGKAKVAEQMLASIARFGNAIVRSEYLKRLASVLDVAPAALGAEFNKTSGTNRPAPRAADQAPARKAAPVRPVERNILRLLLEEQDFVLLTKNEVELSDFQNEHVRSIVAKIFELTDRGERADASVLMNSFDDQTVLQMISGLLASEDLLVADKKKMHRDCIQRIKQERSRSRRQRIMQQMADAQREGNSERLKDLTMEFNQLIKGING